jgi:type IV pilus assembly protein PilY1
MTGNTMTTQGFVRTIVACVALHSFSPLAHAAATDISSLPMSSQAQSATPNVIFGIDDSGSMDFELLLPTNDGAAWWNIDTTSQRFWDTTAGTFAFNTAGAASNSNTSGWQKYSYLFPNGSTTDARQLTDGTGSHYAIPPLPAYAYFRSAAYNPLYYNPAVNYTPWVPAYISSALRTFSNAPAAAARSHPWFPTSGSPKTMDLTVSFDSTNSDWTAANFTLRMVRGMTIPGASVSGMKARRNGGSYTSVTTDIVIASGDYYDVAIPYFPATYYMVDSTCTGAAPGCATTPDGKKLRRYEIKSGNTFPAAPGFPSGRTYAQESQNFANWFSYYRKRDVMLSSAAGQVFSQIKGLRGGTTYFNGANPANITMYDFGATADSTNVRALLGAFYMSQSSGGTPTRATLDYIGQQLQNNSSIIQYACQRNNAFIVTDGFANTGNVTPLSYSQSTWINARPFTTTTAGTLADIAAAYYTRNPRTDLTAGMLSIDPTDPSPSADKNPNLHMSTYALTIGSIGTIYGKGTAQATNPYLNYPTWPSPNVDHSPTAVDDLWHATINSRGSMFTVKDSSSLVTTLRQIVAAMLLRSGSDASVAVSNVNVRAGDNTVYVSSYNGQYWSGELAAFPIDVNTGAVVMTSATQIWEARDQLTARTPASRVIVTYNGSVGVPFQVANLPASYLARLDTPSVSPVDNAAVVAYLRGDRTGEGTTYRTRNYLLGDIVSAQPTVVKDAFATYSDTGYATFAENIAGRRRMIYAAGNDGMLHAFDAANGAELWAYIPGIVAGSLNALTNPAYSHQFTVDGTPTIGDIYVGGTWKTALVAGLNAGGNGYYALDVTSPVPPDTEAEVAIAAKVMWEFPNASTTATVRNNIGLTFGRPILAKTTASGWVALVTSGYNNTAGDGKGYLFVLDAGTGALIKAIATTAGSATTPSGLGQISAYAESGSTDATIDFVYGGDLLGNLWRFDLSGAVNAWNMVKLASFTDAASNPQPISAAPELVVAQTKRLAIVGTGLLIGQSDVATTQTQSIYAVVDDRTATPTVATPRTALYRKIPVVGAGAVRNIPSDAVDLSTYKGWFFDLPGTGERLTDDLNAVFGAIVFATNQPSPTACNAKSYIYVVDAAHGGQLQASGFQAGETPWSGKQLGASFASQPVIAMLASGMIEALTHGSDNSLAVTRLPISGSSKLRRITWKEILR